VRSTSPVPLLLILVLWTAIAVLMVWGCAPSLQQRALEFSHEEARYVPPATAHMAKALAEVETRLTKDYGVTLEEAESEEEMPLANAWGVADMEKRIISLPADLAPDARFEVLLHEAAHIFQPMTLPRDVREVFAEVVMVKAAAYYGWDASGRSARYLSQWKSGFAALPFLKKDVEDAVKTITGQKGAPQRWQ
jgi:hypothetical protein